MGVGGILHHKKIKINKYIYTYIYMYIYIYQYKKREYQCSGCLFGSHKGCLGRA